MKNVIIIQDWAGNVLFRGKYTSKEVDKVLEANRCHCDGGCESCDDTGYCGDFEIFFEDTDDPRNIYELINY